MKKKVTISSLLFWLYSFLILWPSSFSTIVTVVLYNAISVAGVLFLVSRKYRPQKLIVVLMVYYVVLCGITFYNRTDNASINLIVSYSKLMVYLGLVDYMMRNKQTAAVNDLFQIIFLFVVVDFVSLLAFPNGIKQTEYVWNEWSTSYDPIWFFGRKNNRIFYYIILDVLSIWKYNISRTKKNKWFVILAMVMGMTSSVLEESSTSIIVSAILSFGVICFLWKKEIKKIPVNLCVLLYGIFEILLVGGSVTFLAPIINDLFHKDLTFSGRSLIWNQILVMIAQKPILGWGYMKSTTISKILGSKVFTSAHNQWLNFLFQGGIVLFGIAVMLFAIEIGTIKKQKANRNVFIMTVVLISLFVDMLFESQFNGIAVGLTIIMFYEYSLAFEEGIE